MEKKYSKLKNISKNGICGALALSALVGSYIMPISKANADQINSKNNLTISEIVGQPNVTLDDYFNNVDAEEKSIYPDRKLKVSFDNPAKDSEASSNAFVSLNELTGAGSDVLSIKTGLNKLIYGRTALVLGHIYASYWITLTSHELAHVREGSKNGEYSFQFKMKSPVAISNNFIKFFGYTPTDDQHLKEIIAGLNQNELDSYALFEKNINEELTFDRGISFLITKLWDLSYHMLNAEDQELNDIDQYTRLLNKKRINSTKTDHLVKSMISDALSATTYDSINAIFNYIAHGKRSGEKMMIRIGDLEITPPIINHYLTLDGSFFNGVCFINPKKQNPIEVSLGIDGDFISGKTDRLRAGVKIHTIGIIEDRLKASPFAYISTSRTSFGTNTGYSIGVEAMVLLMPSYDIIIKPEYNNNEIVENVVKGKEGFNVSVSVGYNMFQSQKRPVSP
jgi:hypothetical protein